MPTKEELLDLLRTTETVRLEKTVSTDDWGGRNGYLKVLVYVNRFGRGIGRVQSELASNGNAPAAFHPDIGTFKVIVPSTLHDAESILTRNESILTQRIREWAQQTLPTGIRSDGRANMVKVLEIVGQRPEATQQEIATEIGVSLPGVKKLTSSLKDMGLLTRKGPDFGGRLELVGFKKVNLSVHIVHCII